MNEISLNLLFFAVVLLCLGFLIGRVYQFAKFIRKSNEFKTLFIDGCESENPKFKAICDLLVTQHKSKKWLDNNEAYYAYANGLIDSSIQLNSITSEEYEELKRLFNRLYRSPFKNKICNSGDDQSS